MEPTLPKVRTLFAMGAHVRTDLGEGFVTGRTRSFDSPNYMVLLIDGTTAHTQPADVIGRKNISENDNTPKEKAPGRKYFKTIELITMFPLDHPDLPKTLRDFILSNPSLPTELRRKPETQAA